MAYAVHLLPFFVGKSSQKPKKAKRVISHMEKIMSHSQNGENKKSANNCHEKRMKISG